MENKNENSPIFKSEYFKWGLTAFIVIIASVLTLFVIFKSSSLKAGIAYAFNILMPIVDGLVVAYLLCPLVNLQEKQIYYPFLEKKKINVTDKARKLIRFGSVIISMLLVILVVWLFIKTVIPQVFASVQAIFLQMPQYEKTLIETANNILIKLNLFEQNDVNQLIETYYEDIMEFVYENVIPSVTDMKAWLVSLYSSVYVVFKALFNLLIGFFIAIYLLISKENFKGQAKKLIYAFFKRERANLLIADLRYVDKTFGAFIVGKLVDSLIIGMICFIITTLCQIPYALLISVIIGVTNIIPFFGPFLGAIPTIMLVFLISPIHALYLGIIIIILQQIDGNLIGPLILGNSTGLSGFWVIFSITLFGAFFGVAGMFLGVPAFACLYAWLRRKMRIELADKELTYDTNAYVDLKFVSDTNEMITNEDAEGKAPEDYNIIDDKDSEVNFISLTDSKDPVSANKKKNIKNMFISIKDFFVKLFKKK